MILWSLGEFGVMLAAFLAVLVSNAIDGREFFAIRKKQDQRLLALAGLWLLAVAAGAAIGLFRGHDPNYLLGDAYRFSLLPAALALVYFVVRDRSSLDHCLRSFVIVYGVLLVLDVVRFGGVVLQEQDRLTTETAHQAGIIAPLVIFMMLYDSRRLFRFAGFLVLLEMFALLVFAQMFTPLLALVLALAIFLIPTRRAILLAGLVLAVAAVIVSTFYLRDISSRIPAHLRDKVESAQNADSPMDTITALSGTRMGEILYVLGDMLEHPTEIPFGSGHGSMLSPEEIGPQLVIDWRNKHYIHAGLFDALYRNGLVGFFLLAALFGHLFLRGRSLYRQGDPFGLLAMAIVIITVLLLSFDMPFESPVALLGLAFAGLSVREFASAKPAAATAPPALRKPPHFLPQRSVHA